MTLLKSQSVINIHKERGIYEMKECVYVCVCVCVYTGVKVCVCVCVQEWSYVYAGMKVRLCVLYIDPWLSCQSEILCTGHTCENKWKQSQGWMEMYGCYEMIDTDAHMRYRESQSWVSLSLQSEDI